MRCVFTLVFWFSIQIGWAQRTEIDSLENLVSTSTGTAKVDALNALVFKLVQVDFKRANQFIEEASQLAKSIKYEKGLSESTIYQGLYKIDEGNRTEGMQLLMKGKTMAKACGNFGWEGYALTQIGNTYTSQGLYDSAKVWYDQSNLVLKDSLNPWHLSVLYKSLSLYFHLTSRPNEELQYLLRTLAIREKLSDKVLVADVLTLLARWHLDRSDQEKAIYYLDRAEKYVEPGVSSEVQKRIIFLKATILFLEAHYNDALKLFYEVQDFFLQNSNYQQYVQSLNEISELLLETGNYDVSLINAFDALKTAEDRNFLKEAARAQFLIGRNYYRLAQLKSGHEFAATSILISRKNGFEAEEASGYSLEGVILKSEKKYGDALFNFEKALEIRKKLDDSKGFAASLSDISQVYELQGKLHQALEFQLQSVAIKESILHQSGLAWGYYDLGSIYTKLKDFANAKKYLDKAEAKARYIKSGIVLLNVYRTRRDLLMAQNQLNQALRYTMLYEQLNDSVNSSSMANRILSLQSVYELEKKDQEIQLLSKSKQLQSDQILLQENRIQRQQFWIIAGSLVLVLISALAYTLYSYFKKTDRLRKEVQERSEEIEAQSEELTETNNSLVMLNMDLAEKQEELTAQSEELSEANSQFVHLNYELAEKQKELETQAEELRESNEIISELNESLEQKVRERTREMQQAYTELDTFFYRSSHDFRRPLTTFMGLSEVAKITVKDQNALNLFEKVKETAVNLDRMLIKLQSISDVGAHQFVYKEVSMQTIFESARDAFSEAIDQFGIRVSISVGKISTFFSYPAFLKIIVENLVENSIQFRGKTDPFIHMQAIEKYGGVEITIQDNGQGVEEEYQGRLFNMFFRGNEHSKGNGLGLYIVKKAVGKLSGTLHLDTTFGKGTTLSIWIPLKQTNTL
ncbi:MAG TPA: tetratricopeptide repeat protein [Chryseolinea sp.]|nr:tetratricopeptide repeat protein [Chryseolinea sp.]